MTPEEEMEFDYFMDLLIEASMIQAICESDCGLESISFNGDFSEDELDEDDLPGISL